MTKKNLSFLGMPNNNDIESLLEKNYQSIRPLEYRETLHSNTDGKSMFAFWTPIADNVENYTDYKAYLDVRSRKISESPKIVKYSADTTVGRLKQVLGMAPEVLSDKTGVVKPQHADTLNSTTTNKVNIETDGIKTTKTSTTGNEVKHNTEHSIELPNSQVGAVKPKPNTELKTTTPSSKSFTETKVDAKSTDHSIELPGSKTGAVNPKHDEALSKTTTSKKITSTETEAKTTENSEAAKPSASKLVGIVKPKDDLVAQKIPKVSQPHTELNFNTTKIRHIKNK